MMIFRFDPHFGTKNQGSNTKLALLDTTRERVPVIGKLLLVYKYYWMIPITHRVCVVYTMCEAAKNND